MGKSVRDEANCWFIAVARLQAVVCYKQFVSLCLLAMTWGVGGSSKLRESGLMVASSCLLAMTFAYHRASSQRTVFNAIAKQTGNLHFTTVRPPPTTDI